MRFGIGSILELRLWLGFKLYLRRFSNVPVSEICTWLFHLYSPMVAQNKNRSRRKKLNYLSKTKSCYCSNEMWGRGVSDSVEKTRDYFLTSECSGCLPCTGSYVRTSGEWSIVSEFCLASCCKGGFRGGGMPPRCQTLCNMTLKQHNPGVHCNKKRHQWHQIRPFIFTWPLISGCVL